MFAVLYLLMLLLSQPEPASPLSAAEEARRDALARYSLGILRARNDLPIQAIKQFEAAAKADPAASEPLKSLVPLYADLGRHPAAIRTAKKVLELDRDDADTAHTLGKLLYEGKQYSEATKYLRQAADSPRVADQPVKRFGILRDLARAGSAAANWSEAEWALRTAEKLLTEHHDKLLRSKAFPDEKELDREAARIQEKLGEAFAAQKKYSDSLAAFRNAHSLATKIGDQATAARLDWNLSGLFIAESKYAEALVHLNRFLTRKPSGTVPYERLAELLRRTGQTATISTILSQHAVSNSKNPAILWVLASELAQTNPLAAERIFTEQLEKTNELEFFRRYVRFLKERNQLFVLLGLADRFFVASKEPKEFETDRARAFAEAIKGVPELAEPLIRQALTDTQQNVPRTKETWEFIANLAERDGQLASAEVLLRRASRGIHDDKTVALILLDVLSKQRKWELVRTEAAGIINRANPGGGRPLIYDVYLATAYAEMGNDQKALEALAPLNNVKADGERWVRLQKPRILNILGRHQEAAAECLKILADFSSPADSRQVRFVLADAYNGLKEFTKAEAELRLVLDQDPDDVLAMNNLGYYLADQGRNLAEAEQLVRRAIEVDAAERLRNHNVEAEGGNYLDSLGWVLLRRGKLNEAKEVLEKASRMPDAASDPIVWDHLGDVRFRLGNRQGARGAWEKAAELYTDSHQGRQGGRLQEVRRKLRQTD